MKYNIAILHYSAPPVVGGVEEVIKQQALLFRRNLLNVKIIAGKGAQFENYIPVVINPLLLSNNDEVNDAINLLRQKNDMSGINSLKERIKIFLKNELQNFDILIVHNILNMRYNLPAAMAVHEIADEMDIKVINWAHDSLYFYEDYDKIYDTPPFDILKRYNPKINYVTITESRRELFAKLMNVDKDRIFVVKNGIDPITFFRLDINTVKIINNEDLYNQDIILVQPSRLHPRKNIELTIKVVKALTDKGVKAKALITGAFDPHEKNTVNYFNKLNTLIDELNIREYAILLARYTLPSGEVIESDRVKIRDLYHIADMLFLPSIQEGFGIPLLEAGMLKIPIVCSDIPPFREIANNYATFFKLDEDVDSIADKVIKVSESTKTTRFFRKTLRDYSWDNIFKKSILPLFNKIYDY